MNYYNKFYIGYDECLDFFGGLETLLYHYLKNIKYKTINIDYSVILSTRVYLLSISEILGFYTKQHYLFAVKRYIKQFYFKHFRMLATLERGNENWKNVTHLR